MKKTAKLRRDIPFNELPLLPPDNAKIETISLLRQVTQSSIAISELKGLAYTLPNPSILLNAVILKEARVSSEIENVITTHDKLYQALSEMDLRFSKNPQFQSIRPQTGSNSAPSFTRILKAVL